MSLTPLPSPPPLLEKSIFFALPSTNGALPAELKFRENTVYTCYQINFVPMVSICRSKTYFLVYS